MESPKEDILQIGKSIKKHVDAEISQYLNNKAFARACCQMTSNGKEHSPNIIWLTNKDDQIFRYKSDFTGSGTVMERVAPTTLKTDGIAVYKNTKVGEILTKYYEGQHSFTVKAKTGAVNENQITIYNRATYLPNDKGPEEVEIRIWGDDKYYRFQRLSDLLNTFKKQEQEILQKQDELKRIQEEQNRIAKELAEQKEREERERLERLNKQKEEEQRERQAEIDRIEQKNKELENQIQVLQSFMRKNIELRSQHLLDPYQEDAKRSHIFDGVPIVIDGGPGTGKTTTMIQRLKFLLSKVSLEEYEAPLKTEQIEYLTDPDSVNSRWLFFSPTDLLLRYLQANMREEGLSANDTNTRTIPKFRNKAMRDYQLFNPAKDGPFKDFKPHEGEDCLIKMPEKAIKDFEQFIIASCAKTFEQRASMKTSGYEWWVDAERIKSQCAKGGSIKDVDALMRLFNSLHDNEKAGVKKWKDKLKVILGQAAMTLQQQVLADEEAKKRLQDLFERWRRERLGIEDLDEDEAIVDDEEDDTESVTFSKQEFESQLFSQIKQLIKQMGLRKIDSKIKLSKRNQEVLSIVEPFLNEDVDIDAVGKVAWFVRNFASLCRGTESNLLGIIPKLYKAFRKSQLEGNIYDKKLLKKIIDKDGNKHLHPDEQNLLLGFINEMLNSIHRKSKGRFDSMKHKYAIAYKESVRPVIGIDEATDYSKLDYYFMVSFRHYEFSSITLCGDIMQGLNSKGINDWNDLKKFIMPSLEVKTLDISYRQLPTLLDLARELYKDDQGEYPSYRSDKQRTDNEPKPLLLISDDEEEKARWISERILDIYDTYKELPSIAIFVGDKVNIPEFIERMTEMDLLNGIDIVDCSGDNQLQNKEQVRVFRLSEVKGMEFEATFFYDIDNAISSKDERLMRRYLYVGISRATSHLAATMNEDADYDIIQHFETKDITW
ncbi:MAG: hypothetical protein HUJ98_08285 [Bacteroidaceae bacterium]|nr:hypothetical protein [Bacteroidaceae bacterium]